MEISIVYPANASSPVCVRIVYSDASPWQAPFDGLPVALQFIRGVSANRDPSVRRVELFPAPLPPRLQHLERPAAVGVGT